MAMRLALLIALATALALPANAALKSIEETPIKTVPVVKTWQDLLNCTVIHLKNGVKVRLGVEALTVPHGGTPLLYACVENYSHSEGRDHQLGPLYVELQGSNHLIALEKFAADITERSSEHSDEYALFAMPLVIDAVGEYCVIVSESDNYSV